jgi:hypothetical protein
MDGASLKNSSLAAGNAKPETTVRKQSEKEGERWAMVLADAVAPRVPTVLPASSEGSTGSWRSMDSALTRAGAAQAPAGAPGAGDTEGSVGSRLTLAVTAGDLGEISIVVDRGSDGMRVQIGVLDPRAARSIEPERAALERALVAAGLEVESVSVVRQGTPFGMVPARVRSGAPEHAVDMARREQDKQSVEEQRRAVRRLDLKG